MKLLTTAALLAALLAPTAASADNWGGLPNVAKEAAEFYLDAKYATELQGHNVELTKSEFTPGPVGHLAIDVLFDGAFGGTLVYVPATGEVYVYSKPSSESALNGTAYTKATFCPPGAAANNTCTGETLVGNAGGSVLLSYTAAVTESCEWTPNFRDTHSC